MMGLPWRFSKVLLLGLRKFEGRGGDGTRSLVKLSSIKLSHTHFSHESVLRSSKNDTSESRFLDDNGVVDDMDGYLNCLSLKYDSVWVTKPSWYFCKRPLCWHTRGTVTGLSTAVGARPNPNKSVEVTQPPTDSVSSLCFNPKGEMLGDAPDRKQCTKSSDIP
ncbi:hypothetical protein MRB53_030762 [Persea americana]|uniref:Uncharacterized protein n=1 Tax=Persea americana TaxID=3435 RepID=A0ACC2KMG1_PERAE|nr:hypothetical protein MRB53_030762 [Persea americana]